MVVNKTVLVVVGSAFSVICALGAIGHASNDVLLTGRITSSSSKRMEGVTVSARRLGKTFTTSVFTDAAGEYYFPRLEPGKYKIWTQAVGYGSAILEDVTLSRPVDRHDFALKPQSPEKQLRGDEWLASLPEDTVQDKKMKEVIRISCQAGCHSPATIFQNRFDEKGWKIIIDVMSRATTAGAYTSTEDSAPLPNLQYWKDELATYLARVRGPTPYALKFKPRPRPKGDETLAVFWEYDSPAPGAGVPLYNDGSLWELGPPNGPDLKNMRTLRGTLDNDGNPWITGQGFSYRNFAKIDWKTGKFTNYVAKGGPGGRPASTDELFTDGEGVIWLPKVAGQLVRVDRTGKMDMIKLPEALIPGAGNAKGGTPVARGNVRVWWDDRAKAQLFMYEPKTHKLAVYDIPDAPKGVKAHSGVYNVTSGGDADGNGWWSQMGTDLMLKADGKMPGKVISIPLPKRNNPAWELFTGDDRKIFEMLGGAEQHGRNVPNQHAIRMVGAGPGPTDSVWGSGWTSGDLFRINIRTHKVTMYKAPLPDCAPYQAVVDAQGQVWTNCTDADYVRRFDPRTEKWTRYDLPTLGTSSHSLGTSPVLVNGRVRVVVAAYNAGKTVLLEVRTKEDVQALKAEVAKASVDR